MKENNITLNINVSEQKQVKEDNEALLMSINDKLDSIGIDIEKIEAFNQLINIKLDEVKEPPTKHYKNNSTLDNLAIDIFCMQSNINNYIMLSYSISEYTTKINKEISNIYDIVNKLKNK